MTSTHSSAISSAPASISISSRGARGVFVSLDPGLLADKKCHSEFLIGRGLKDNSLGETSSLTKNDPYVLVSNDPEDAQLISWQSRGVGRWSIAA